MIGIPNHSKVTRKEVQTAFIVFAIENQLVNLETRKYDLTKFEILHRKLGTGVMSPNELFHYLQKVMTELTN